MGGTSYNEGRVEVNYDGTWGTVCDDGWSTYDAQVVCRQLGFGSSGTAYSNAYFGQGSGPILLDNVACNGSEFTLAMCRHLGVGIVRSCSHYEDAGVRCSLQGYNTQDINKNLNLKREVGIAIKVRRQVASLAAPPFKSSYWAIYACIYNAPAYN